MIKAIKCKVCNSVTIRHTRKDVDVEVCKFCVQAKKKLKIPSYKAKVICAWCNKQIGFKVWDTPDAITHGICRLCKKGLFNKHENGRDI
jgi:hypothetical protein